MASTHPAAPRTLWKGAISFGLVHIPVALYSATTEHGINFDWLDKRSMDPVGYKRVNKKTGKEIARENIVRGIEYDNDQYVVLSDDEIAAAYPRSTRTIEIERFVPAHDIPFVYLERPYYVAPIERGAKVYALLRETLQRSGRIGLARVIIQTRQHLSALIPSGTGLVLDLLRWGDDIRSWESLTLPPLDIKKVGVTERELKMAEQLIEDMSGEWEPAQFTDSFQAEIMRLVDRKIAAGKTQTVIRPEAMEAEPSGAKVIDLTELLRRSLRKGKTSSQEEEDEEEAPAKPPARKTAARRTTAAAKRPRRRTA